MTATLGLWFPVRFPAVGLLSLLRRYYPGSLSHIPGSRPRDRRSFHLSSLLWVYLVICLYVVPLNFHAVAPLRLHRRHLGANPPQKTTELRALWAETWNSNGTKWNSRGSKRKQMEVPFGSTFTQAVGAVQLEKDFQQLSRDFLFRTTKRRQGAQARLRL